MSIKRRICRLEQAIVPAVVPWLTISRTDKDNETEGAGFDGFPARDTGETWDAYTTRAQLWSRAQAVPPFLAHVEYRDGSQ